MGPIWMAAIIVGLTSAFLWSAKKRFELLSTGRPEGRFDRIPERIKGVVIYALAQRKMHYYRLAGLAHMLIFIGFGVLLLRTLILWGRGFWPSWNLIVLGPDPLFGVLPLGHGYEFAKDLVGTLVVAGAATFIYFRAVRREARMTLSGEGLLILGIICTMMISDMVYDGAAMALVARQPGLCVARLDAEICETVSIITAPFAASDLGKPVAFHLYAPVGSLFALAMKGFGTSVLVSLAHIGFWTHSSLVLVFLNILPFSKHFHIITAIPNVFFRSLDPPGRLPMVAKTTDDLMVMVEAAMEQKPDAEPVGKATIEDFSWKAILDFYTCTECGRCTDNCPAHITGKILSPKQLALNLRDHLYANEEDLIERRVGMMNGGPKAEAHGDTPDGEYPSAAALAMAFEANAGPTPPKRSLELVGNIVHADVLWACTTCRACEEQCPVMISYVDKIVDMRRNLVLVKGEMPAELNNPFSAMETNGNPWNMARMDRAGWSDGLDIPMMSDKPDAKVLYWVGCAGSYDDRAKKVARATAKLMQAAGVEFAILGQEETCTGDPARRAGNEYLFMMLAEQNAATLNGYKEQGGIKTIITACPHCFNTLANEYPDFGAKFEVVHHAEFLLGLLAEKKLLPKHPVKARVVYHDSCYLGRYNGIYEQPRDILKAIPGVELVEAEWSKNKGLCCGAGGGQMWMEEQNKDRVNVKRTLQLLETKATTVASACPFCMTMLTDGLKDQGKEEEVKQMDVAELLAQSCLDDGPKKAKKPKADDAPAEASA